MLGEQREAAMESAAARLEDRMTLLGASGVEDRLQDGVPACIRDLKAAGIKVWLLTGDKWETAVQISQNCGLLHPDATLCGLHSGLSESELSEQMQNMSLPLLGVLEESTGPESNAKSTLSDVPEAKPELAVVVDGPTLQRLVAAPSLQRTFVQLCSRAVSVVCCRMAPKQKADIVMST